jgi:uncharacterized membrane protein
MRLAVFGFPGRRLAEEALRRLETAADHGILDLPCVAVVRRGRRRPHVRYGLPAARRAAALSGAAATLPLLGLPYIEGLAQTGAVVASLPDRMITLAASSLSSSGDEAAVVVTNASVQVLLIAEAIRPTRPGVLLTTLDPDEEGLLVRALAATRSSSRS